MSWELFTYIMYAFNFILIIVIFIIYLRKRKFKKKLPEVAALETNAPEAAEPKKVEKKNEGLLKAPMHGQIIANTYSSQGCEISWTDSRAIRAPIARMTASVTVNSRPIMSEINENN